MSKQPGYEEAITELEDIIAGMEEADVDVDQLAEKVKRAAFLIAVCRAKLKDTEQEVSQALKDLEDDSTTEA